MAQGGWTIFVDYALPLLSYLLGAQSTVPCKQVVGGSGRAGPRRSVQSTAWYFTQEAQRELMNWMTISQSKLINGLIDA